MALSGFSIAFVSASQVLCLSGQLRCCGHAVSSVILSQILCLYLSGLLAALRGLPATAGRLGGTSIASRGRVSCVTSVSGVGHGTGFRGGISFSANGWLFCSCNL